MNVNPAGIRTWEKILRVQARRPDSFAPFEGENDSGNVIECKSVAAGDGTKHTVYSMPISSDGQYPSMSSAPGASSSGGVVTYPLDISVHYAKIEGGISNTLVDQQGTPYNLAKAEHTRMTRYWGEMNARSKAAHLCGDLVVNAVADHAGSMGEPITAFNNTNVAYAPGTSAHTTTSAVGADTTAILTSEVIDSVMAKAREGSYAYPIAPAKTPLGSDYYVLFTPRVGALQLKANTSNSRIHAINIAMIQGGKKNPFNEGTPFIYDNVLVVPNDFMPQNALDTYASAGTTYEAGTRVSVLCGAGALKILFAGGFTRENWLAYARDKFMRQETYLMDTMRGCQRNVVNGGEWAQVLIVHNDTYVV